MKSSPRVPSWLRLVSGLLLAPALPAVLTAQSAPQDNWTLDRVVKVSRLADGLLHSPTGVRILSDETIAVVDHNSDVIKIFGMSGQQVTSFGSRGTGDGQFMNPWGIVELKDGNLAVSEHWGHRIQVFSKSGAFIRKFGSNGAGSGQFQNPAGIEVLADGKLMVCDQSNNRIQIFEPDGTYVRQWGVGGYPNGAAIIQDGRVAVACRTDHTIRVYNLDGSFVRQFGSWGTGDGQFRSCIGVAVLADGKLAVTEYDGHRIQVFFPDGTFVRKWGSAGSKDGEFASPHPIALSKDGRLFVPDTGNGRVQIFSEVGDFLGKIGIQGDSSESFGDLRFVDRDKNGNIVIVQRNGSKPHVTVIAPSGSVLNRFRFSSSGFLSAFRSAAGKYLVGYSNYAEVYSPAGDFEFRLGDPSITGKSLGQFGGAGVIPVAADDGSIFAADLGNTRIQRFSNTGLALGSFGEEGDGPGRISGLYYIGVASDGLVVTRTQNALQRFAPNGELVDRISFGMWSWGDPTPIVFASDGVNFHGSFLSFYSSGSLSQLPFGNEVRGFSRETGEFFKVDGVNIQVWRRGFRTLGVNPAKYVPIPGIVRTKQRSNGYVDIDYTVTDADSPTVTTALVAYRAGSALVKDIVPLKADALVESSSTKVGANVPTGVVHRVTWNPANSGLYSGDLVFEVLARDDRPKMIDIDYITLPTAPALTISRSPLLSSDLNTMWAWLLATGESALTRAGDGEVVGPGGVFTYTSGSETKTNFPGRAWLLAKLGVREATADEVQKAKLATSTSGSPNRFTPSASQRMGSRPQSLNEWTFDSADYGSEAWWVVPLQ